MFVDQSGRCPRILLLRQRALLDILHVGDSDEDLEELITVQHSRIVRNLTRLLVVICDLKEKVQ